jgi:hypothetical protein
VAEIFIGVTRGWSSDELDVESVRDNLDAICDREGYVTPAQANDEIGLVLELLAR